ncbi:MAG: hypothetical protein EON86_04665 [Brevundimonas sp.]|nr:MAG: hypothetical protein EON86_04665 [Brevundimonas sp.]
MPKWLLQIILRFEGLRAFLNRFLIGRFARSTPARPHRFSLWNAQPPGAEIPNEPSRYTSWPGLLDRSFTGRHLAPVARVLPPISETVLLFDRQGPMQPSERSSVLFCFFAQWFTDSFLRTMPDLRRTDSNHEIDLCQIYGLDEVTTWALRAREGGRLKCRIVDGLEHPCLLYVDGQIDPQFAGTGQGLSYLRDGRWQAWEGFLRNKFKDDFAASPLTAEQRFATFEATGLERGNSTVFYAVFNTIFLREHNRIARLLEAEYAWDDDRLFETARLINIRQLLTVVVDDYIRHLGGSFPFSLDRSFAEKERWYRTNRITLEFNLLYRWHSLVPDAFTVDGTPVPWTEYRFNNAAIDTAGLKTLIEEASRQPAGRMSLFNTPAFLSKAEAASLSQAQKFELDGFNAYRKRFRMPPYVSIEELSDEPRVRDALNTLYKGDVDAVEFTVGLLAEKRSGSAVLSPTLQQMVAYDAFTHILTNPVLSTEVHCEATYSRLGWDIVHRHASLRDIVQRNMGPEGDVHISLAHDRAL